MKMTKKELVKLLIENFTDWRGNLNISGLDFRNFGGNVLRGNWKVGRNLSQGQNEVGGILYQGFNEVNGDLEQNWNTTQGDLEQTNNKVKGTTYNDFTKHNRVIEYEYKGGYWKERGKDGK